jgi:hypothetical protein
MRHYIEKARGGKTYLKHHSFLLFHLENHPATSSRVTESSCAGLFIYYSPHPIFLQHDTREIHPSFLYTCEQPLTLIISNHHFSRYILPSTCPSPLFPKKIRRGVSLEKILSLHFLIHLKSRDDMTHQISSDLLLSGTYSLIAVPPIW